MEEIGQYHSVLHDADNKYHTDPDCPLATTIVERCRCDKRRPKDICEWCRDRK